MPYKGEGIYQHYKGGLYEVLGTAMREETFDGIGGKVVVVYKSLQGEYENSLWTRPLDNFNEMVRPTVDHSAEQFKTPDKLPPMQDPLKPVPRFRKLSLDEIRRSRNARLLAWYRAQIEYSF